MSKKLITGIALVAMLGLGGFGVYNATQETEVQEQTVVVETPNEDTQQQNAEITDDGKIVAYSGVTGESALATLRSLVDVETESSDFGEFVTSIAGVAADSSSQFWAFYVNGELASVGAGDYQSATGDLIEWKLESF